MKSIRRLIQGLAMFVILAGGPMPGVAAASCPDYGVCVAVCGSNPTCGGACNYTGSCSGLPCHDKDQEHVYCYVEPE